jgi:hypothetical protein
MAIEIICACGTKQHVPNSAEGTEIKCIHCGRGVLVTLQPQTQPHDGAAKTNLSERRMELENYSLTVKFQPDVAGEVGSLLKLVAATIGINAASCDGIKVKAGWSILTIRQHIQELTLEEPDFSGDPHKDTREDLSVTLRVLALQSRLLQMVPGIKLVACNCFDTVQVPEGVFLNRKLFMRRIKAPTHSESGFYISPTDPLEALKKQTASYDLDGRNAIISARSGSGKARGKEPERTHNLESYLLLKERSAMIQVLGLPSDHIAEFDGNELVTIYGGLKNKIVWKLR